jgi:hypothetical protein
MDKIGPKIKPTISRTVLAVNGLIKRLENR